MSSARDLVLAALAPLSTLAGGQRTDVLPYARAVDVTRRTVMVRVDQVRPFEQAPFSHRSYTFALVLLTPLTDPTGPADDDLDELLEQTLLCLDEATAIPQWSTATRATYQQTTPAYEITLTVHARKADHA